MIWSRYDSRKGATDGIAHQPNSDDWLWRVRWLPCSRWAAFPWALVVYPWWRRREADLIDPDGQLQSLPPGLRQCSCGASWMGGALCPNCMADNDKEVDDGDPERRQHAEQPA